MDLPLYSSTHPTLTAPPCLYYHTSLIFVLFSFSFFFYSSFFCLSFLLLFPPTSFLSFTPTKKQEEEHTLPIPSSQKVRARALKHTYPSSFPSPSPHPWLPLTLVPTNYVHFPFPSHYCPIDTHSRQSTNEDDDIPPPSSLPLISPGLGSRRRQRQRQYKVVYQQL